MRGGFPQESPILESIPCLCGSACPASRTILAKDEGSEATFTYLECPACSLERLCPRPAADRIGAFYPAGYAPHLAAKITRADRLKRLAYEVFWAPDDQVPARLRRWRPLLRAILAPIRHRTILAFTPPVLRRVFEFGAARATDLLAFKAAGWAVEGCEPSAQACALAHAQGIHLQNATAETAILPHGAYGCILFNNVFEHIHDPVAVLAKCHEALEPRGLLLLIVPNHRSWTGRLVGAAWPGYDAPRHIWGWTPRAIRQQLALAGFSVEAIHHRATGAWLWRAILDGRHAPNPVGPLRRWLSRNAAALGIPFGILAAAAGHGDFMRVLARRA